MTVPGRLLPAASKCGGRVPPAGTAHVPPHSTRLRHGTKLMDPLREGRHDVHDPSSRKWSLAQSERPVYPSGPLAIRSGIPSPLTCSKAAMTFEPYRNSWATATSRRRSSTPMSSIGDRPEFAARSTDFEAMTEDDMLIRITRPDKTLNATQVAQDSRVSTPLSDNPAACYADRKATFRILCGSI